jgi:hypothetical protein
MPSPRLLSLLSTAAVASAMALGGGACSASSSEGVDRSADEIVDVPQSSLKNQSISNCWMYATMGWAESLHAATGEPELNISESYLSYWHWFDQLVWDGAPGKTEINEEGFFKGGMDLIGRFGVMSEGDFIADEATSETSRRQASAKSKLSASMKDGALKTPEARKDKKLVRRELDKAWELSPDVVAKMNAVFGEAYDRSLDQPGATVPAGSTIRPASAISVMLTAAGDPAPRRATLADAIGERDFEQGWGRRKGPLAWNEWDYPTNAAEHRAFEIRIQRALHARQPVVIAWFIDFGSLNSRGELKAPPAQPGHQGGHVTVLEDYQVDDVPGFGTLKAGVAETRPEALAAALAPSAKIEFFRTKNSWGSMAGPAPEFNGYLDLYMNYLNGPVKKCDKPEGSTAPAVCVDNQPLWRIALPAGF